MCCCMSVRSATNDDRLSTAWVGPMAIMFTDWAAEGRVASDLARVAGKAILKVYATRFEVRFKGPNDPVTDADLRAQDIIVEGLSRAFPHDGIISEECPVSEEARLPAALCPVPRKFRRWVGTRRQRSNCPSG